MFSDESWIHPNHRFGVWWRTCRAVAYPMLGSFVLIAGYCGIVLQQEPNCGWLEAAYKTAQLVTLQYTVAPGSSANWLLQVAEISAVILVSLAVYDVVVLAINRLWPQMYCLWRRAFVVVCGASDAAIPLVQDLRQRTDKSRSVVVIEQNSKHANLDRLRAIGATVIISNPTDVDELALARIERASEIFVVTNSDAANIATTAGICRYVNELAPKSMRTKRDAIACYVQLLNPKLIELFQQNPVFRIHKNQIQIRLFNSHLNAARMVIRDNLTAKPPSDNEILHVVQIGFGSMGQATALHAVRMCHFTNRKRLRLSLFDEKMAHREQAFRAAYPRFAPERLDLTDIQSYGDNWGNRQARPTPDVQVSDERAVEYACNAEFIEAPAHLNGELIQKLLSRITMQGIRAQIIICSEDETYNFETSLYLRDRFRCLGTDAPAIHVWLPHQPALAELLTHASQSVDSSETNVATGSPLIPFGKIADVCRLQEITRPRLEELAEAIHRDYEQHATANRKPQSWQCISESHRQSSRLAADHLLIKLRCARLSIAPPNIVEELNDDVVELLAEVEHNRWMADRLLDGWSYGPRDNNLRQRPSVTPWAALPDSEREYDRYQVRKVLQISINM